LLTPDILMEPEPEPIIETLPEEIFEPEPEVEPESYVSPDPLDIPPSPGPILEPEEEEILPDEEPPVVPVDPEPEIEPEIDTTPEIPAEPEIIETTPPDAPELITTAPSILASPDAPSTEEESDRAVPQSQADTLFDPLGRPRSGSSTPRGPGGGSVFTPSTSPGLGTPPSGGTRRPTPGAGGWQLDPSAYGGNSGEGLGGVVLDMRCREETRTHEDCPEYMAKFKGRNAAGYEAFGSHSSGAAPARSPRTGTYENPAIGGGTDPWALGIGNSSVNNGGPSTTVLDDADFGREFLGTNLGDGSSPNRVRDIFNQPVEPWTEPIELLEVPPETLDGSESSAPKPE
jgi:hypothetical protein